MNNNVAVVTRADFDAAVTRMERNEATDEDYNLVCAYIHRLGWRIGDDCPESNTEAILYSELIRE